MDPWGTVLVLRGIVGKVAGPGKEADCNGRGVHGMEGGWGASHGTCRHDTCPAHNGLGTLRRPFCRAHAGEEKGHHDDGSEGIGHEVENGL